MQESISNLFAIINSEIVEPFQAAITGSSWFNGLVIWINNLLSWILNLFREEPAEITIMTAEALSQIIGALFVALCVWFVYWIFKTLIDTFKSVFGGLSLAKTKKTGRRARK